MLTRVPSLKAKKHSRLLLIRTQGKSAVTIEKFPISNTDIDYVQSNSDPYYALVYSV